MALTDNLVSYYSLDEASGSAIDAHGANDLTEKTASAVGSTTGKVGNCRDFESGTSGSSFVAADSSVHNFGDTDFTLACWVNAESFPFSTNYILAHFTGTPGNQQYAVRCGSSGAVAFLVSSTGSGGSSETWNAFNLSTGTWYFVVAWHDAVNDRIYIQVDNGTPESTAYSSGIYTGSTLKFQIGAPSNANQGWDGLIDEVGIWNRVLTADERTELYNSGNGRDYAYISGGGGVVIPVFRHHYRQQGIM